MVPSSFNDIHNLLKRITAKENEMRPRSKPFKTYTPLKILHYSENSVDLLFSNKGYLNFLHLTPSLEDRSLKYYACEHSIRHPRTSIASCQQKQASTMLVIPHPLF